MKLTSEIIKKLPKAELHCHLDGSLRIDTILNLASDQRIKLPSDNKKILESILMITAQLFLTVMIAAVFI